MPCPIGAGQISSRTGAPECRPVPSKVAEDLIVVCTGVTYLWVGPRPHFDRVLARSIT
jgi:hypothetical protein